MDPTAIKHALLSSLWLDYIWEQYLCFRQYRKVIATTEIPEELKNTTCKQTFELAKQYTLEKKQFGFIKDHVNILISTLIIHLGILPVVWDYAHIFNQFGGQIVTSCIWYFMLSTATAFMKLPLTIYEIFVIEASCRLKKKSNFETWGRLKSFIFSQIFITLLSGLLVQIIEKGDHVVMGLCSMASLVVLVVGIIYPMIPPSRFRTKTPLKNDELRPQIVKLTQRFNFPLKEIYMEERYKSAPPYGIYFFGAPNSKSIVLFDTLFPKDGEAGCSHDEVHALVAQELGRWYHNHSIKYVLFLDVNMVLSFATFFFLFKRPEVYQVFGFHDIKPTLVGVYVVLKYFMVLFSTLTSLCFNYLSRSFMFQDDLFAVNFGKSEALISALTHLDRNNVNFPVYDSLYSVWHHDKPSLVERVAAIKNAVNTKPQ